MDACFRRFTRLYQSLPLKKQTRNLSKSTNLHDKTCSPLDGITFSFSEQLSLRKSSTSLSSYVTASEGSRCSDVKPPSGCSRESDNGLYQLPPRAFMDSSTHLEDQYLNASRDSDQISLSSTASSSGYPRRPDSGGAPLYVPMNSGRGSHSPGSNSKVSVSNTQPCTSV